MVNDYPNRPGPGEGGDPATSIIARALHQRIEAVAGRAEAQRLSLLPVRAYVLLAVGYLGFWAMLGVVALVVWLMGQDPQGPGEELLAWDSAIAAVVILAAAVVWHVPQWRGFSAVRPPDGRGGTSGYLLRHAGQGGLAGPVNLAGGPPPVQFWYGLNPLLPFNLYLGPWLGHPVGWLGSTASVLTLLVLVTGAVQRRSARKKSAREKALTP
ncbi:hypothetical protein ACIGXA_09475 [Streptomyces fildesensis]|uniref:Integral membrane protein n=1 Tax=Streptomyces fildesensis TaxID=375757 RepID=A0ABW8C2U0_9ACTN